MAAQRVLAEFPDDCSSGGWRQIQPAGTFGPWHEAPSRPKQSCMAHPLLPRPKGCDVRQDTTSTLAQVSLQVVSLRESPATLAGQSLPGLLAS
jgi:hypothetical protein